MKERYKLWLAPDGGCLIYDMGIPSVPIIVQFPSDYPGGAEAAARAEAARLNALPVQAAYRVERHPRLIDTWMVVRTASETVVARFYPDAPGGARVAAEKQVREWNEEAQ